MNTTADMALNLIPEKLQSQPVFLCIDDTMVSKFGKKIRGCFKAFDHAAHNGSNYLNGHCFVSVMVCVPVWNKGRIHYLSVPLGYRMWQKKESKLELAASMIRHVMPVFHEKKNVIILCDSWYVKKNLVSIIDEYENLDMMKCVILSFMTCRRSAYRKKRAACAAWEKLSIQNDFTLSDEKSVITIWPCAVSLLTFLEKDSPGICHIR